LAQFYPSSVPESFSIQTYVIMAVLAVEVVLFGSAYIIRAKKIKQFFPFKMLRTVRGTYIAPHFVLSCVYSLLSTSAETDFSPSPSSP
jgi:hypothetical protein